MNQATARGDAHLTRDLILIALSFLVLAGAVWGGVWALYDRLYSPTAFVQRYLGLLADGHAVEALAIPGVAVDSQDLEAAGLPATPSEALLRSTALGSLTDIEIVSAEVDDSGVTEVTASYVAGGYPASSTFAVAREGSIGPAPVWRFETSPLAIMDLTVSGSMSFDINGFEIDKRQVSVDGADADPAAAIPMLIFSPGAYSVSVDSAISATPGVAVIADSPFREVPVSVQAQATDQFVEVVRQKVTEFLDGCATQEVLQPTACPFGRVVADRVVSNPLWSIVQHPVVDVQPDGDAWTIPAAEAVARLDVEVQSLYDGTVTRLVEDVPFTVTGHITVLPDGSVSIMVSGSGP